MNAKLEGKKGSSEQFNSVTEALANPVSPRTAPLQIFREHALLAVHASRKNNPGLVAIDQINNLHRDFTNRGYLTIALNYKNDECAELTQNEWTHKIESRVGHHNISIVQMKKMEVTIPGGFYECCHGYAIEDLICRSNAYHLVIHLPLYAIYEMINSDPDKVRTVAERFDNDNPSIDDFKMKMALDNSDFVRYSNTHTNTGVQIYLNENLVSDLNKEIIDRSTTSTQKKSFENQMLTVRYWTSCDKYSSYYLKKT